MYEPITPPKVGVSPSNSRQRLTTPQPLTSPPPNSGQFITTPQPMVPPPPPATSGTEVSVSFKLSAHDVEVRGKFLNFSVYVPLFDCVFSVCVVLERPFFEI